VRKGTENSRFYSLVGQAIVFCGLLGWACGPRNFMKNSQSGIMTKA
jgi:hypothetical protein